MTITEGLAKLNIIRADVVSKAMGVFYNPAMSLNRDISVLLLNSINKNSMQIGDPLAASGVRGIRFLKELKKYKIKNISINDIDENSIKSIKTNLKLNKISYKNNKRIKISNEDANLFLLKTNGLDYIDIDPFGSPNFLLNNAILRLARGGILAVTATDTSALCGTYPKACIRKYWAAPKNDYLRHETGLRILIRKVQLIGAQYDKALAPIFSYSKEHYMRVFFRNEKGKNKADEIMKMHGMFNGAGPMWIGSLWDSRLCNSMYKNALKNSIFNKNVELLKFLKTIKGESRINSIGFYDVNHLAKKNKIKTIPKKDFIKKRVMGGGYGASDTHFTGQGVRSDAPLKMMIKIMKNQ
jgi:tRNA (guanine26-N2/guanine27-N2)-dimethyltransferase